MIHDISEGILRSHLKEKNKIMKYKKYLNEGECQIFFTENLKIIHRDSHSLEGGANSCSFPASPSWGWIRVADITKELSKRGANGDCVVEKTGKHPP